MRNAVLLAETVHRITTFDAELGLQRTGFVIQAGMDHAAVVSRLMRADAILGFEDDQSTGWFPIEQGICGSESNDPAADNYDVRSHRPSTAKVGCQTQQAL